MTCIDNVYPSVIRSEAFTSLVSQLLESLQQSRAISERSLLDFTRFAVQIIYSGEVKTPPSQLTMLCDYLRDYWQSRQHTDDKYSSSRQSYLRLFSVTNVLTVYFSEQHQENELLSEIENNRKNIHLFAVLYEEPGINHEELHNALKISSADLVDMFRERKLLQYVYIQRVGEQKIYNLTASGSRLYKRLIGRDLRRGMAETWSIKRFEYMSDLLQVLAEVRSNASPGSVYNDAGLMRRLLRCNEKELQYVLEFIKIIDQSIKVTYNDYSEDDLSLSDNGRSASDEWFRQSNSSREPDTNYGDYYPNAPIRTFDWHFDNEGVYA